MDRRLGFGRIFVIVTLFLSFAAGCAPLAVDSFSVLHNPVLDSHALIAVTLPKGPDVIFPGDPTRMVVFWQQESSTPGTLEWGIDTSYSLGSITSREISADHRHRETITGLEPGAKYLYRVALGAGESTGSFLAGLPSTAGSLSFYAYGDTRDDPFSHDSVAAGILNDVAADPSSQTFVLFLGDLISDGDNDALWAPQFFDPAFSNIRAELANLSFLPARGNHEGSGILFSRYFPMPFVASRYWSFDYGPAHIAIVDQYVDYGVGSDQYAWLENDLSTSDKPWKFITLHEPGWSASGRPANITVETDIEPLAKREGVAIIFGGHNHYYARAIHDGMTHLTVGGGGAPLMEPEETPGVVASASSYGYVKISIEGLFLRGWAFDPAGVQLDSFSIKSPLAERFMHSIPMLAR